VVQMLSILIIGLCVGWLGGLSVSPVVATIIASIVGIAGGVVAGIRAVSRDHPADGSRSVVGNAEARPAAVLALGIAIAAPLGIMARTYGIFEPQAAKSASPTTPTAGNAGTGALFGVTVEQCTELLAMTDFPNAEAYRTKLAGSDKWGRLIEAEIPDTDKLKSIVEAICGQIE
jgi:hypothetical protein